MGSNLGLRVEYHILQSFPVTCLNRDDVGAPKTAIVGGTKRARVSSQCWKRQVRLVMHELGAPIGMRTKYVKDLIKSKCMEMGANETQAEKCGAAVQQIFLKTKKDEDVDKVDTVTFLSPREVEKIAEYFKERDFFVPAENKEEKKKKDSFEKDILSMLTEINKKERTLLDAWDIALFGRMVALEPKLNVEAAASFSHAISTHEVDNEIDFFTAVDDKEEGSGSAHMGVTEFNSATYYRYIGLNLVQLKESLGSSEAVAEAVDIFTRALYLAVPYARQHSYAGYSSWDYAIVYLRKGQGLQVCFDAPVYADQDGFLEPSQRYLREYLDRKEALSGSLFGKIKRFDFGWDKNYSIDNLIADLKRATLEELTK